ncbi:hypothetical protein ACFOEN_09995 [Piscinibacterium candidicorallinum]|uniref:Uncharacterized protein n=2 Tax=Piscinibacterium candidicorallinum TaxID=1793872 RepID=A0ABV7H236_9BURK
MFMLDLPLPQQHEFCETLCKAYQDYYRELGGFDWARTEGLQALARECRKRANAQKPLSEVRSRALNLLGCYFDLKGNPYTTQDDWQAIQFFMKAVFDHNERRLALEEKNRASDTRPGSANF